MTRPDIMLELVHASAALQRAEAAAYDANNHDLRAEIYECGRVVSGLIAKAGRAAMGERTEVGGVSIFIHIEVVDVGGTKQSRQVEAVAVFGNWAVHRPWLGGNRWCITRLSCGRQIPVSHTMDLSKARAIKAAKAIDEQVGTRRLSTATSKLIVKIIRKTLTERAAVTP